MFEEFIKKYTDLYMKDGTSKEDAKFLANASFNLMSLNMNLWPITDEFILEAVRQYKDHWKREMPFDLLMKLSVISYPYINRTIKNKGD